MSNMSVTIIGGTIATVIGGLIVYQLTREPPNLNGPQVAPKMMQDTTRDKQRQIDEAKANEELAKARKRQIEAEAEAEAAKQNALLEQRRLDAELRAQRAREAEIEAQNRIKFSPTPVTETTFDNSPKRECTPDGRFCCNVGQSLTTTYDWVTQLEKPFCW
jgi:uncharacterized membrane protein YccC